LKEFDMHRLSIWMCGGALALLLAGCATTSSGLPCESCDWGYRTVTEKPVKALPLERRVFCVIDGKVVDCKKTPAECPECAKLQREKK
jgi:hypothetical protein